ncbi:SDR family NAD(P)-dependent oxidoreductase [Microbacterium sp. No. 7]|uniref:SDR family NAD(P)-dependent oxidoreductase n=1 Tax=Microbacterium sp. No. 7 TaxID=1714373 RepID=UPI0006D10EFB|nr:SDR family oxidoreductase [Microbacterium sp. No. 7]ALJ18900.1 hypothetical protein AOA12_02835 [Microbacterium sp. No. 7]
MSTENPDTAVVDYAARTRLDGRTVLVVGAGQGIGLETSRAAAALGAHVICLDLDRGLAEAAAAETGGTAKAADVTSRADVERLFGEIEAEFGRIHGIADIIGASQLTPIDEYADEDWERALRLNLTQAFYVLQLGARVMTDGGSIVFVGSVSGLRSAPQHAAYGAAKAGLLNLVRSAAVEYGPRVRVNAVSPGQIRTPRMQERHRDDGFYEYWTERTPLGRPGEPSDIASALMFFLTDQSAWVSGEALLVDGGTAKRFVYAS